MGELAELIGIERGTVTAALKNASEGWVEEVANVFARRFPEFVASEMEEFGKQYKHGPWLIEGLIQHFSRRKAWRNKVEEVALRRAQEKRVDGT